jgi:hypothetical protein
MESIAGGSTSSRLKWFFSELPALEQIVGRERRERELIADFQLPIVDLIRTAASTQPFGGPRPD